MQLLEFLCHAYFLSRVFECILWFRVYFMASMNIRRLATNTYCIFSQTLSIWSYFYRMRYVWHKLCKQLRRSTEKDIEIYVMWCFHGEHKLIRKIHTKFANINSKRESTWKANSHIPSTLVHTCPYYMPSRWKANPPACAPDGTKTISACSPRWHRCIKM